MRERAKKIIKHPLISGSSVVFVGSFIASIFSYFFNFAMGRMMSPADYGLLTSLTSLILLLTIFGVSFSNIFAKFSAKYIARGEFGFLSSLIKAGTRYILFISLIIFLILLLLTFPIMNFLHIDDSLVVFIIFISIFLALVSAVPQGVLQGALRFYMGSFLIISQSVTKFLLGVILVFLGLKVLGAVIAILISTLVLFVAGFITINKYLKRVDKEQDLASFKKEFFNYTYSFTLASLGITMLANTDIILVRHFFSETVSGQYAALSLMGKAIFYLLVPVNFVFFPLISQKKEKNEKLLGTLIMAGGIVFLFSLIISFIYFAFPGFILRIFFPAPEYKMLAPYLGFFSLYILIFSVVNIINSYFLSIGKTKAFVFPLIASFIQIFLISMFHNNLYQIIFELFSVSLLLFVAYLVYYMKNEKIKLPHPFIHKRQQAQ